MFLCNVYVSITPISNPLGGQSVQRLRHFDVVTLDKVFKRPGFIKEMFSNIEHTSDGSCIGNITITSANDPKTVAAYSTILTD